MTFGEHGGKSVGAAQMFDEVAGEDDIDLAVRQRHVGDAGQVEPDLGSSLALPSGFRSTACDGQPAPG